MSALEPSRGEEERQALRGARVSVAPWGADLVVGWNASWGPSLGRIVRGQTGDQDEATVRPVVLGAPGATSAPPCFATFGERVACAWIDEGGARLAWLSEPRPVQSALMQLMTLGPGAGEDALGVEEPMVVAADASAVAFAEASFGRGWIVVATPSGIFGGSVSPKLEVSLEPWFEREGAEPRLAVADVGGAAIVVAIRPGEAELIVMRAGDGAPSHTTHRLEQPVAELAMMAVGSRVALAVLDATGKQVLTTFVDARGKLVERPVAQIDRYVGDHAIARIDGVAVTWTDDRFRLVAHDADAELTLALPLFGPTRDELAILPRVAGPPWARTHRSRLEVVGLAHDDDEGLVTLARARPDGSEAARLELRLAPPTEHARARAEALIHAFAARFTQTLAGSSYRDATLVAVPLEGGVSIELPRSEQRIELRFLGDRRFLVQLATGRVSEGSREQGALAGLLDRVRSALGAQASAGASAESAWAMRVASALALGPDVLRAEVVASGPESALVELELRRLPSLERMIRWIEATHASIRSSEHRALA